MQAPPPSYSRFPDPLPISAAQPAHASDGSTPHLNSHAIGGGSVTPSKSLTAASLWPYAGSAVVTVSSADKEFVDGKLRWRKRAPLTRGLNRNHNPRLKEVFKGAANAAAATPGPLKDIFDTCVADGVREERACPVGS